MTQDQINAAYAQMTSAGHSHEAAVAAIEAHIAAAAVPVVQQEIVAPVLQQTPVAAAVVQAAPANVVQQTGAIGNLLAIAGLAAAADDQSVIRAGFAPAAAGRCTIRLRGYIEVGVHKPSNAAHKNREMVHLVVEVNSPDHLITEDGVTKPREIVIRVPKAHSGNAGFPRLFAALNAAHGNKYKHIGEMLGQAWCAEIFHSAPDSNGRVWENFDSNKTWSFAATSGQNMDLTQYSVQVPELVGAPLFMVFDNNSVTDPTHIKALWDSIYIAGTRESQGADGVVKHSSKNYYQELIRASLTWTKSKTYAALSTQCAPETLEPVAPRVSKAQVAVEPTQTPTLNAQIAPVLPQQAAVAPVVMAPQVAPVLPVQAAAPEITIPAIAEPTLGLAPQVVAPTVVAPAEGFVPPQTVQQQQAAAPVTIAPQAAPVAGTQDPNAFLAQFAVS